MISEAEAIEKYGQTELLFSSYYKYSFDFKGIAEDGASVYVSIGGCSDDIYRYEVIHDKAKKLIECLNDGANYLTIELNKELVFKKE